MRDLVLETFAKSLGQQLVVQSALTSITTIVASAVTRDACVLRGQARSPCALASGEMPIVHDVAKVAGDVNNVKLAIAEFRSRRDRLLGTPDDPSGAMTTQATTPVSLVVDTAPTAHTDDACRCAAPTDR